MELRTDPFDKPFTITSDLDFNIGSTPIDDMGEQEWDDFHSEWFFLDDLADEYDLPVREFLTWWTFLPDRLLYSYCFRHEIIKGVPTLMVNEEVSGLQISEDFWFRNIDNVEF